MHIWSVHCVQKLLLVGRYTNVLCLYLSDRLVKQQQVDLFLLITMAKRYHTSVLIASTVVVHVYRERQEEMRKGESEGGR